jgi:hypothetical protein
VQLKRIEPAATSAGNEFVAPRAPVFFHLSGKNSLPELAISWVPANRQTARRNSVLGSRVINLPSLWTVGQRGDLEVDAAERTSLL